MKHSLFVALIGFGVAVSSCNQTGTTNETTNVSNNGIDTLAVVAKIDKQADSLSKLVSDETKKAIFREKVEGEPLHNNYFYDKANNLIKIDVEYYDGGTTYHILDGKIIRMMHADEAGEGNVYVVDQKTFCETTWNGDKMVLASAISTELDWQKEFNGFVEAAKVKPLGEAEQKLIGEHKLKLQWLNKTGTAKIYEENGVLKIDGEHIEKDGFVKVKGDIEYVNDKEIIVKGTVSSKSSIVNNNEVCERKGDFNFKSTKGRKYWRMQQMENCEGNRVVDYIDIFF